MTYRKPVEQDRELLETWIAADPDHRDKCKPDFWMIPDRGVEVFVAEDEQGQAIFVRVENCARLHMQFPPATTRQEKYRTAKSLAEGFQWLKTMMKQRGYRQFIFDSISQSLIGFCERFGFLKSEKEYVSNL